MMIRTLQAEDAARLMAFELENRAWFEQYVEARGDDFYTPAGLAAHIADYLETQRKGGMHPCVLLDDHGAIIGRANLRYINRYAGIGEVGYRIAHDQARKGLASAALTHLQEVARTRYGLTRLRAWISEHNTGSQRVMDKCGFRRDTLSAPRVVQVGGGDHLSHLYYCAL
ncbi:GNAT family N-acetyltransferase [Duganella callida]|uniref:N-acetyltransferase n=1 Tax=Duganella callida TaxID=2561932 RepID=A0A4Y9S0Q0_9BURK|nr:GNAT family N-acetyltransferase [Duganella callida]TFW14904.1 N-acetyltransferase [Duganella callida]